MKNIYRIGLVLFCAISTFCMRVSAQTVTNVTATQVGKNIHVSYDLDKQADITLHLSTDGGKTYQQLTEVTQALWLAVMGNNPSRYKGDDRPVERVSWNDCQEFIHKLNSLTGKTFRLPTEAEWEYAARGGSKSKGYKYSGSDNLVDVAWYWQNSGDKFLKGTENDRQGQGKKMVNNNCRSHPVKSKLANELGLYDMSGNVWEWCEDYVSSLQTNPTGPSSGSHRVFRGGCWLHIASFCRVSYRVNRDPVGLFDHGFRLALSK